MSDAVSDATSADETSASETRTAVDRVLEQFRERGGRVTAARRAIVTTMLGGDGHEHLTAEQVAARLQGTNPEIAVSTVYRSLDALEELGVVEHVHVGHGATVFHPAADPHLHLVCKVCGTVLEMPDATLRALGHEVLAAHGFTIEPRHFAINGTCQACSSSESTSRAAPLSADRANLA